MGACALQPMRKPKSGDHTGYDGQRVNWNSDETSGVDDSGSKDGGGVDITEERKTNTKNGDSTMNSHEGNGTKAGNSIVRQGPVSVSEVQYKENIPKPFPTISNVGKTKLINPGNQTESNGTNIVEGSNPAEIFDLLAAGYESASSRSFYQNKATRAIDSGSLIIPNGACVNYQEEQLLSNHGYRENDIQNIFFQGPGTAGGFATSTASSYDYEAATEPNGRPVYDDLIGEFVYVLDDDAPVSGLEIITPHEINIARVNGSSEATTSKGEPTPFHTLDNGPVYTN